MKNTIARRIFDFLKEHPPFEWLSEQQILNLSAQCEVIYLEKNKTFFKENEPPLPSFYIVREGAVGLYKTIQNKEVFIDACDEGDVFGLRPLFANSPYAMTAIAQEESLLYAFPIEGFKPLIASNEKVLNFLFKSFASNSKSIKVEDVVSMHNTTSSVSNTPFFQPITYTKNPVCVFSDSIIKELAQVMANKKIGSVIVTQNNLPLGIITDKDLRSKIATGKYPITAFASEIMSKPVITIPEQTSIAEAQLIFIQKNISHLCITQDGSTQSEVLGIVTLNDIFIVQANNPAVLLKWIDNTQDANDLKLVRGKLANLIADSISNQIPIEHITKIVVEVNAAIIKRAITIAIKYINQQPPVRFSWLNLGSQGRKEQLLLTDQDNALIFENVSKDQLEETRAYFLNLASKVTTILNIVGYEYCPANMMASNPKWCLSSDEWKSQFEQWITKPDEKSIMLCSIFFDFNSVYGDNELAATLADDIFKTLHKRDLFFAYLGSDALKNPPPLSFFRQVMVEQDGKYKNTFDIKSRALMPLVDAARLLVLHHKIKGVNNTANRFEAIAKAEPQNSELFLECASAFNDLLTFRTQEGINNNNNGRFVEISNMRKTDKVKLKNAFKPIQQIQSVLKNRFNLTYFT